MSTFSLETLLKSAKELGIDIEVGSDNPGFTDGETTITFEEVLEEMRFMFSLSDVQLEGGNEICYREEQSDISTKEV